MTLIIIFSTIVFFIFGYLVMSNIDRFLDKNVQTVEDYFMDEGIIDNQEEHKSILIFGDNKITSLIKDYCDSQNYVFRVIEDINNIDKRYKYLSLFALSNNDADNLMLSSIGLKVYSIPHIITLCNSRDNLKIYNEFNFEKVIMYDDEIDKIYNDVKGLIENVTKNQA